jgi:hypothetical protein
MTLKEYYKVVSTTSETNWLLNCLKKPSKNMKKSHIAIIRLVLKQRGIDHA